jgi:hypothetical protein
MHIRNTRAWCILVQTRFQSYGYQRQSTTQPLLSLSIVKSQDLNSKHTSALYPEDDSDF